MTQPIPASKQLASHCRSGRGACGFVLVGNPDITTIWITSGLTVTHPERGKWRIVGRGRSAINEIFFGQLLFPA